MVYISIGSNLGNRLLNLRQATTILQEKFFPILEDSIVLETQAILPPNSPPEWNKPYLNMVVRGNTTASPIDLLQGLKKIEQTMGQPPISERWAPRIIDLDILLMDDQSITMPPLTIPHPELFHRPFLLHLMAMLDPQFIYGVKDNSPYMGMTFGEIAHKTPDIHRCFTQSFALNPQFVGIVNITPDSFSDGGKYFKPDQAIAQVLHLNAEGASVIEIGAQSTRPGAMILDHQQEYNRLQPVLENLSDHIKNQNIKLSIDTFSPEIILKILRNYPVSWINDVTGNLDRATLLAIAESGCKIVAMHSVEIPANQQQCLNFKVSPLEALRIWAEKTISHLINCGFSEDTIILDPGIGFGKSTYQNISVLQEIKNLKKLGCQILVGHSRKHYISSFYQSEPAERDLDTIAISESLMRSKVDYIRVHNVTDHQRFFVAQKVGSSSNY